MERRRIAPPPEADRQLELFDLAGRGALVVGLGESGLAMARWAAWRGARVRVADTRDAPPKLASLRQEVPDAEFVPGEFGAALLDGVDVVAWSPGVSIEKGAGAAFHRAARERGVPVFGEIELFAQALAGLAEQGYRPRLLAVTGTNGKTTTTRLLGHLCECAGRSVRVAGNIAPAALDVLREALQSADLPEVWVVELSSFQLALTDSLRPDAAAILNVTQDHLDWHESMRSYVAAKQRIFHGAGVCVYNRDDPETRPPQGRASASFGTGLPAHPGEFGFSSEGGLRWLACAVGEDDGAGARRRRRVEEPVLVKRLMPADALLVRGTHNQLNALAALALGGAAGLSMASMLRGLRGFAGEPHRFQQVATIRDVDYYDDSKGTNVGATVAALEGLGRRCVLIAGGDGKGQDFSPLADPVRRNARAVVLIGRDAPLLRAALAATGVECIGAETLEEAVRRAAAAAQPGDAVLLSPACASFDMFRSYGHRSEVFVAAVRELAAEEGAPC